MGYAGFSFYTENEGKLKALEVDSGKGCVGAVGRNRPGRRPTPRSAGRCSSTRATAR